MKSKNELKEINNKNRVCYYFDDIINGTKSNFSNILLDKTFYENISVYNILCKTLTGLKPLYIRFNKIEGFIISLDGKIKHLILLDYKLFNKIWDKIKYLKSKKKKMVLKLALIIIMGRLELIHIIFYLLKRY